MDLAIVILVQVQVGWANCHLGSLNNLLQPLLSRLKYQVATNFQVTQSSSLPEKVFNLP